MSKVSTIEPTIANVFLSFCEVERLEKSSKKFKPVFYRRDIDDIFVLYKSAEYLFKFCDYFNIAIQICLFPLNKKKMESCYFLIWKYLRKKGNLQQPRIGSLLLVVCTPILKVSCQHYTNLVWFILWLILVSTFVLVEQSFTKNLVF